MDNTVAAIIGVIGTLIGAIVGAIASYKGAMNGIKKQINYEENKINQQKEEDKRKAADLINYYLKEEIRSNFNKLYFNQKNKFKKEFERALSDRNVGYNYYSNTTKDFSFEEYNTIKYNYIAYLSEELIDIYKMFYILHNARELNKLDEEQFNYVKNTYLKYKDKY